MANYQSLIGERVKIYERDETDPNQFVARGVLRDVDNEGEGFFIIDHFRYRGFPSIIPQQRVDRINDYRIVKDEDQPNNDIPPVPSMPSMPSGSPYGGTLGIFGSTGGVAPVEVQPTSLNAAFAATNTMFEPPPVPLGAPLVPTPAGDFGMLNNNVSPPINPNANQRRSRRSRRSRRAVNRKRRSTHARRRHRRS